MAMYPKTVVKDGYLTSPTEVQFLPPAESFPKEVLKRVAKRLRDRGDREIIVNAGLSLSNLEHDSHSRRALLLSEVEPRVRELCNILHHFGVRRGDMVHQSLCNSVDFILPVMGAWLCGAAVTMADPALREIALAQQLEDTGAKVIFCHNFNLGTVKGALKTLNWLGVTKVVVVDPDYEEETDRENQVYSLNVLRRKKFEATTEEKPLDDEDTSFIIWSSGTTGRPKGIQHGFKLFRSFDSGVWSGLMRGLLLATCFYHVSGFMNQLNTLYNDGTMYFYSVEAMEEAPGEKLMSAVAKFKPVFLMAGSYNIMSLTQVSAPADADLSSLQMVFPVGTNLPTDPYEVLKAKFPSLKAVGNWYGLTEFGNGGSMSLTPKNLGYVNPGTILKIVDPDTGRICGPNEVGEIRGKCELMSKGYWKRPEETAKLFDEEGFMRCGDLGHYDEDNLLYFDARLKELIKYKNCHLYPIEIEELLMGHPAVKEVGVFGVPDPLVQEMVTALVVRKEGSKTSAAELVEYVGARVDDHKRLRGGVYFVDGLPRSKTGKTQRVELRNMFEEIKKNSST